MCLIFTRIRTPDTSSWTQAQKQALLVRIYRDYWDPTYVSESAIDQSVLDDFPPAEQDDSLPLSAHAGDREHDLSGNAAERYGMERRLRGRVGFFHCAGGCRCVWHSGAGARLSGVAMGGACSGQSELSRAEALRNYDGQHDAFRATSVSDTNNGDPILFSSYASLNSAGTRSR